MKIGILTFQIKHGRRSGSIGSSVIRGEWLVNYWKEAELWHNGMKCDVLLAQKVYWKEMFEDFPGMKILDLCDPDWNVGDYRATLWLKEYEQYVDAITTSTKQLQQFVRNVIHNIPVQYIPDRMDMNQFLSYPRKHEEHAQLVVWFGYAHNNFILNQVLPFLQKNHLDLLVVSNNPYRPYNNFGVNITNVQWDENADLAIQSGDFTIIPKMQGSYWDYKSNNRILRSWANGLPVAQTEEELKRFCDPQERTKEIEQRFQELQTQWHVRESVKEYQQLIDQYHQSKT